LKKKIFRNELNCLIKNFSYTNAKHRKNVKIGYICETLMSYWPNLIEDREDHVLYYKLGFLSNI